MRAIIAFFVFAVVVEANARSAELEDLGKIQFTGDIKHPTDISGVGIFGNGEYLVIGADEGVKLQILKRTNGDKYKVEHTIPLVNKETKDEIDIEGIAIEGRTVYVIGSHSRKRPAVKVDEPPDKTQKENRERLTGNELEPLREGLYRLKLNANGELDSKITATSLRRRLDLDPVLKIFSQIPSKENGVDIEGIAVKEEKLYAAFRGPVLREGFVPILEFDFDKPEKAKTLYVNLDGRGIRDIVSVESGFLLIGGPVGDAPVSYELYFWDGEDGVPGTDTPLVKPLKSLGQIPVPDGGKAEGVTVLKESLSDYEILIVYDSVENGGATRFRVPKNN